MTSHIEQLAHELIDGFIARNACEFVEEFAVPLPATIITEQLGLPKTEIATFRRWADAMLLPSTRVLDMEELLATARIEVEAQRYLANLFDEKRRAPSQDLISAIVHAGDADRAPLQTDELLSVVSQLINGGFESVTTALGHACWWLIRRPELMDLLRKQPELIGNFINEVLRIESPTQGLRRRAARDVMIGGTLIPEGSIVIVRYGAANRDPEKFACPAQFDIHRSNVAQHLAFGAGPHFCVGAHLARRELTIAVQAILERLDKLSLARPLPSPVHNPNFQFFPLKELPIRFESYRGRTETCD